MWERYSYDFDHGKEGAVWTQQGTVSALLGRRAALQLAMNSQPT
jgi:hypothetical protein